jgi:hypothetical protein
MKRKKQDKFLSVLFFTCGIIGLIFIFCSCSAVKKVNRDPAKQLKVIQHYKKNNPAKNDTTITYLKGDTVTHTVQKLDTLYLETLPDTVNNFIYKTIPVVKTITVNRTVRDTLKVEVLDRELEKAFQNIISGKDRDIMEADKRIASHKATVLELKHNLNKWKLRFFILLGLNTLYFLWKLKRLISPI